MVVGPFLETASGKVIVDVTKKREVSESSIHTAEATHDSS
jgi:hypothetical protein